jgi:hypothetical protein
MILTKLDGHSKPEPFEMIHAEKHDSFLNNLEKCVEATVRQDDIDDEEVIRMIRDIAGPCRPILNIVI